MCEEATGEASTCKKSERIFYFYFRPMALFLKALGLFPVLNVGKYDSKKLRFNRFSLATLYSSCIFAIVLALLWYYSAFDEISNHFFTEIIVIYVMIGRSAISFFFCVSYSNKIPRLMQSLDAFDRKYSSLNYPQHFSSCVHIIVFMITPIVFMLVFIGCTFIESKFLLQQMVFPNKVVCSGDNSITYASTAFGFLSVWQVAPLIIYIYFTGKIKGCYDQLNLTMQQKGCAFKDMDDEKLLSCEETVLILRNLRSLHTMATRSVYALGECYGNFMAVDQLCLILMIVVNANTFLFSQKFDQVHLLVITGINIFIVLSAVSISDAVKTSGTDVVEHLQSLTFINNLSPACQLEIQGFLIQIISRPVEILAAGYFVIDKKQIPSILSSIATYLIVWIQFNNMGNTTQL